MDFSVANNASFLHHHKRRRYSTVGTLKPMQYCEYYDHKYYFYFSMFSCLHSLRPPKNSPLLRPVSASVPFSARVEDDDVVGIVGISLVVN